MAPSRCRRQLGRQEDGRRAVGAADNADGSRLRAGEAQDDRPEERQIDAQLCRRAQQQALGIGQQGAEVCHGAHTQEDQRRIQTGLDADVQKISSRPPSWMISVRKCVP